jgi:hypothetical protein
MVHRKADEASTVELSALRTTPRGADVGAAQQAVDPSDKPWQVEPGGVLLGLRSGNTPEGSPTWQEAGGCAAPCSGARPPASASAACRA